MLMHVLPQLKLKYRLFLKCQDLIAIVYDVCMWKKARKKRFYQGSGKNPPDAKCLLSDSMAWTSFSERLFPSLVPGSWSCWKDSYEKRAPRMPGSYRILFKSTSAHMIRGTLLLWPNSSHADSLFLQGREYGVERASHPVPSLFFSDDINNAQLLQMLISQLLKVDGLLCKFLPVSEQCRETPALLQDLSWTPIHSRLASRTQRSLCGCLHLSRLRWLAVAQGLVTLFLISGC